MERLTKRLEDGRAAMDCTSCPENWADKPNSDCTALYCRNRLKDRVAAYEQTGMDPEDIERMVDAYGRGLTLREDAAERLELMRGISTARLRELAEADKDGRCVVLPCKVGAPVWLIYDDCEFPGDCGTKQKCRGCEYRNIFAEEQAFCLSMLSKNGKLGHPYYTSIEAAEAALKGEQDE